MRNPNSEIGGYFELEVNSLGSVYHDNALALNSGRNALEYIVKCKKYILVHVPYFTCEVILQPLKKLKVEFKFYHIDECFIPLINEVRPGEAVLYTNYFGINYKNVNWLSQEYNSLIIDNAQAFYDKPLINTPTFYSPRKFFGLPDGGFVYGANEIELNIYEKDDSSTRISHLIDRVENGAESGYLLFKENDKKLDHQPIKRMSNFTHKLLEGVNFEYVKNKRLHNFVYLHQHLKYTNKLGPLIDKSQISSPLVYPYWVQNGEKLRKKFFLSKIFTAQYWPNVLSWVDTKKIEFELTKNVVCLPIDQRYSEVDLNKILEVINNV